jgi:hypothetical protein
VFYGTIHITPQPWLPQLVQWPEMQ